MSKYQLTGTKRTILGKKVVSVRSEGFIPATVYGKGVTPMTISVEASTFTKLFAHAGETGLIELTIEGKAHPVLIHNVQKHPVTKKYIHIEFHEVNLKEKVHAEVPIELVGEPIAVKEKVGLLLPLLDHIEVEALPTDLPEKISIDISHLALVDEAITVKDIILPKEVTLLTDDTVTVVKIGAFIIEKEPEVAETTAASTTEEAAPSEGTASEEPSASEEKKE